MSKTSMIATQDEPIRNSLPHELVSGVRFQVSANQSDGDIDPHENRRVFTDMATAPATYVAIPPET